MWSLSSSGAIVCLGIKGGLLIHSSLTVPGRSQVFGHPNPLSLLGGLRGKREGHILFFYFAKCLYCYKV